MCSSPHLGRGRHRIVFHLLSTQPWDSCPEGRAELVHNKPASMTATTDHTLLSLLPRLRFVVHKVNIGERSNDETSLIKGHRLCAQTACQVCREPPAPANSEISIFLYKKSFTDIYVRTALDLRLPFYILGTRE